VYRVYYTVNLEIIVVKLNFNNPILYTTEISRFSVVHLTKYGLFSTLKGSLLLIASCRVLWSVWRVWRSFLRDFNSDRTSL
jgi:hypothetical protein